MQPHAKDDLAGLDRAYRSPLMAFFVRRVWNRADAEDLTQEVFARLARGLPGEMRSPEAYIFQIAANLLRDRARAAQVRTGHANGILELDGRQVDPLDPHRVAEGRQRLARLSDALDALPARTRQIFLLFRYEQIAQRDIARHFGISVSAVEKHIQRALVKLIENNGEG